MAIPIEPSLPVPRGGAVPPGAFNRGGAPERPRRDADGLTREQRREKDDRSTVWAFVWILFAFKAITALVIWWAASRSHEATVVLGATHWVFLLLPAIAMAAPIAYQVRVRRVRRRVAAMRRAEWLVDHAPGKTRDVEALRRAEWMLD